MNNIEDKVKACISILCKNPKLLFYQTAFREDFELRRENRQDVKNAAWVCFIQEPQPQLFAVISDRKINK